MTEKNKCYLIVEVERDSRFSNLEFQQCVWKYEKVNLTLPGKHQARIIDVSNELPIVQYERKAI
jgi:hypothetical protein